MNKKVLIITGGIVLVLLIAIVYFLSGSSSDSEGGKRSGISKLFPLGEPGGGSGGGKMIFQDDNTIPYQEILDKLKSGEMNFVWEIWALREAKCDKQLNIDECEEALISFIDKRYTGLDAKNLMELFKKYFNYERAVKKLQLPANATFDKRYELIKAKRREVLQEEDAKLLFGMEESQVDFMNSAYQFTQESKKLSGEERVKNYEELKRKTYGPYYDALVKREDKFEHFRTELSLREDDLHKLSAGEKESKIHELEVKYFGKDAAEKMAQARKETSENAAKIKDYEKQEKEFLAKNTGISQKEKDDKLRQLRIQVLGQEEADAYESGKLLGNKK